MTGCPSCCSTMQEQGDYVQQWGEAVVSFSSQYGSESSISYTVANIAGTSTTYPSYGDFTQCSVLRTYGPWWQIAPSVENCSEYHRTPNDFVSHDYIELSFERQVYPTGVEIYEVYNPGAVVRILCCDKNTDELKSKTSARWFELYRGLPEKCPASARIFSPPLINCPFPTNLIRIEFNQSKCEYYTELDAINFCGLLPQTRTTSSSNENCDIGSSVDPDENCCLNDNCNVPDPGKTSNIDIVTKEIAQLHLQDGLLAALQVSDNGYFDLLPEEIIQLILLQLDLPSLCNLAAVSHLFYKHCYDPSQFKDLNLQPYWQKIMDKTLVDFVSRCYHLHRLNLSWCSRQTGDGLTKFIEACGLNLTTLNLACCSFVTNSIIQLIAQQCFNLQDLDLSCCQKVENIGFTSLCKLTRLQRLGFYRTKVDVYSLVIIARSCPDLQHMNLGSCVRITDFSPLFKIMAIHNKHLKSLDLWRSHHCTPDDLMTLATGCPMLEELDLGWCSQLSSVSGCFVHLAEKCKNLRKLFVTANRRICNRDINALATHCKNLEQLDILGTREVTHSTIQRLLEQCPKLVLLDLSFCHGMDNMAIHTLRKMFPKVAIKKSFQS